MGGNNEFFENFERNKYLKILPSMQRVKNIDVYFDTVVMETFQKSYSTDCCSNSSI